MSTYEDQPTSSGTVAIRVTRAAAGRLRSGHPWVFATDVTRQSRDDVPGVTVMVYDDRNRPAGIGLLDPDSPIRVRMLGPPGTRPGSALVAERLAAALARRAPVVADGRTDGFRIAHGPNDGLPGLVVDRYADTAVLKLYSAVWLPWMGDIVDSVAALPGIERVVLRTARNARERLAVHGWGDGAVVAGPPLDGPVWFRENGLAFEADPLRGQKTGFFLDQRENRERVGALAAGARVLNVFSYNGGFSLYAARGGAAHVTSVDLSRPAIEAMERNFARNTETAGVARDALVQDAFEALRALRRGTPFDVVVIDPPSFAKSAAERGRALSAYERLARAGLQLTRSGGVVVLASCSSRVSAADFFAAVHRAAAVVGRPLVEIERTGHPLDHPVAFPEAAYLKCLYART